MKLLLPAGSTSVIVHVFIPDSTSTAGAGKTALAYSDITAYYVRAGGALTALTMVDVTTLGTWDSDVTSDKLGLKKLDDTNAPGLYEVHLPANILAAGATSVVIQLRATGAAPTMIEVQLAGVDVAQISNDASAADNLEDIVDDSTSVTNIKAMFDGTGYAGGTIRQKVDLDTIKTVAVAATATVTFQNGTIPITTDIPSAATIGTDAASKVLVTPAQKIVTDASGYVTYSNTAPPSAATIADAVWDEASTGHTDAGKAGAQMWTDIDSILADTNEVQGDLANGGRLDLLIDGIKAKTDSLTFTVGNQVDANIQYINDTQLTGDGDSPPWGPA